MVADPFQIVDHMEQRTDETVILFGQVQGVDFYQITGDGVVQIVEHLLIPGVSAGGSSFVRLEEHLDGEGEVAGVRCATYAPLP